MTIPYGLHHRPGVATPLRRMMLDNDRTARTTTVRDTHARRTQEALHEEAEERRAQALAFAEKAESPQPEAKNSSKPPGAEESYADRVKDAERDLSASGKGERKR